MFPSKLYEVQLSPPQKAFSSYTTVQELNLDAQQDVEAKLAEEGLELSSNVRIFY